MSETKHTTGKWRYSTSPQPNGCPIIGSNGLMIAMLAHSVHEPSQKETAIANAERIVASVNALAGLNPEAVRDAVQALEDFIAGCAKLNPIHFDSGTQYGAFMRAMREQISTALANLKQTTP